MRGPGSPGHVVHVRSIRGAPQFVRDEMFGLTNEVDGERPDRLAHLGELLGGDTGHRGRVETTGQQGAARHVGDQLPAHDVVEEFADMGDGGVPVVGVRTGLQGPVPVRPQSGARDGDHRSRLHLTHAVPHRVSRCLDEREQLPDSVHRDSRLGESNWQGSL